MYRGHAGEARGGEQADPQGGGGEGEDPEGSLHPHGPAEQDQRVVDAQGAGAERVRQNDPGDGGGVHEDPGVVTDTAPRAQARNSQSHKEQGELEVDGVRTTWAVKKHNGYFQNLTN